MSQDTCARIRACVRLVKRPIATLHRGVLLCCAWVDLLASSRRHTKRVTTLARYRYLDAFAISMMHIAQVSAEPTDAARCLCKNGAQSFDADVDWVDTGTRPAIGSYTEARTHLSVIDPLHGLRVGGPGHGPERAGLRLLIGNEPCLQQQSSSTLCLNNAGASGSKMPY